MKPNHFIFLSSLFAISVTASAGTFTAFDARSAAMGGTGVASAQIVSAPFYNPAMLSAQREEENFSLLFGAGVTAQDDDNLLQHLGDFFDAINSGNTTLANSEAALAGTANPASFQVNSFVVLGWSGNDWSMAAAGNGYIKADINFNYSGAGDLGAGSTLDLSGVKVNETNISFATNFGDFAIGLTPKQVKVSTYNLNVSASSNGDLSQIADSLTSSGTDHGSDFNLDAGLVYTAFENIKVGVVYQNILSKSYTESGKKFSFNPTARAGIAYTGDVITLAFDYDLTKNDPLIAGGDQTQYMAAGVEIDLLDSIQLRAGYNKNLAVSSSKPTLSAGFGFNLVVFQLDITALKNNDATSLFLQLGARW